MHVFNSLAPVFLIIALGAALAKTRFLSEQSVRGLSGLTYWVAIPCLLFYKIATASYPGNTATRIFLVVVTGMAASLVIAYLVAWLIRIPAASTGTFVQASYRGNLAFVGLPVVIYTSSDLGNLDSGAPEMLGILVIASVIPIYNLLSVVVLQVSQHELGFASLKKVVRAIATNPLLISALAGALFKLSGLGFPTFVERTCQAIGQMSLPLALISIGASLISVQSRGSLLFATAASIIKTAAAPLVGYYVARQLGLGQEESRIALIYLACPTAAASYIMTDQIGGDKALAASAVVISTVLAMISLGFVVGLQ